MLEAVKLVEVGVPLDCAVGPADFERVDAGARPQADFGPKVVGGAETRSAAYFDDAKVIINHTTSCCASEPEKKSMTREDLDIQVTSFF